MLTHAEHVVLFQLHRNHLFQLNEKISAKVLEVHAIAFFYLSPKLATLQFIPADQLQLGTTTLTAQKSSNPFLTLPAKRTQQSPGPGAYQHTKSNNSIKTQSQSFSKLGYGVGFVSKSNRFSNKINQKAFYPGPGSYTQSMSKTGSSFIKGRLLPNKGVEKVNSAPKTPRIILQVSKNAPPVISNNRKEPTRQPQISQNNTSSFQKPIFQGKLRANQPKCLASILLNHEEKEAPGPGTYNVEKNFKTLTQSGKIQGHQSAFRSGTIREPYITTTNPGPGIYDQSLNTIQKQVKILYDENKDTDNIQNYSNDQALLLGGSQQTQNIKNSTIGLLAQNIKLKRPLPKQYHHVLRRAFQISEDMKKFHSKQALMQGRFNTSSFKLPLNCKRDQPDMYNPFTKTKSAGQLLPGPGSYSNKYGTIEQKLSQSQYFHRGNMHMFVDDGSGLCANSNFSINNLGAYSTKPKTHIELNQQQQAQITSYASNSGDIGLTNHKHHHHNKSSLSNNNNIPSTTTQNNIQMSSAGGSYVSNQNTLVNIGPGQYDPNIAPLGGDHSKVYRPSPAFVSRVKKGVEYAGTDIFKNSGSCMKPKGPGPAFYKPKEARKTVSFNNMKTSFSQSKRFKK